VRLVGKCSIKKSGHRSCNLWHIPINEVPGLTVRWLWDELHCHAVKGQFMSVSVRSLDAFLMDLHFAVLDLHDRHTKPFHGPLLTYDSVKGGPGVKTRWNVIAS
jgi:hypothetical protein